MLKVIALFSTKRLQLPIIFNAKCVHCLNTVVVMKIEWGRFEKFASFQVEWLIIFQMSMKGLKFLLNGVFSSFSFMKRWTDGLKVQ
jgi:hypothetical protein